MSATANQAKSMSRRGYRLVAAASGYRLQPFEDVAPTLGPRDVLVRIKAASINYRDLLVLKGQLGQVREGLIPFSDGAGEVAAIGAEVTRWRVGDRVAPLFYPDWTAGRFREAYGPAALGGGDADGVLANLVAMPETALVRIPQSLSFEEAATLPCAGLTAWHALVMRGELGQGDTVLVQGTGGVALFGLQFASAMKARTIVLSSSDEKRKRATELGAWKTANYRTTPEWDVEVRRLTDDIGVSHILELGGPDTFDRSLRALAAAGHIAQIGVFTGFGPQSNLIRLQLINASIDGINVGSGEHFAAMSDFIDVHGIKPIIDKRFAFAEVPAAYEELASGRHFGKLVVQL